MGIIIGGRHTKTRKASLQLHRLLEFEKTWDAYLQGKTAAAGAAHPGPVAEILHRVIEPDAGTR